MRAAYVVGVRYCLALRFLLCEWSSNGDAELSIAQCLAVESLNRFLSIGITRIADERDTRWFCASVLVMFSTW